MRLVVADEHPLILSGFRSSFSTSRDIRIVAECRDRPAVREALVAHQPSVVALDAEMYEGDLDQPDSLVRDFPGTNFVLLSSRNDRDLGRHAMRTGIRGIIAKERPLRYVERALRMVHGGGLWFDRTVTDQVVTEMVHERLHLIHPKSPRSALDLLTARELEIVKLVAEGLRNKEVAAKLFISAATVSHHLTAIFRKLKLEDRVDLVIYAFRNGVVKV